MRGYSSYPGQHLAERMIQIQSVGMNRNFIEEYLQRNSKNGVDQSFGGDREYNEDTTEECGNPIMEYGNSNDSDQMQDSETETGGSANYNLLGERRKKEKYG